VGTAEHSETGRGLGLPAGPHQRELRAIGHRTLRVDIVIVPRKTLNYEGELEFVPPAAPEPRPTAPAAQAAPVATGSSVMYVIPNCYIGNVPPRSSRLPSGCDIKTVEVLGRK